MQKRFLRKELCTVHPREGFVNGLLIVVNCFYALEFKVTPVLRNGREHVHVMAVESE